MIIIVGGRKKRKKWATKAEIGQTKRVIKNLTSIARRRLCLWNLRNINQQFWYWSQTYHHSVTRNHVIRIRIVSWTYSACVNVNFMRSMSMNKVSKSGTQIHLPIKIHWSSVGITLFYSLSFDIVYSINLPLTNSNATLLTFSSTFFLAPHENDSLTIYSSFLYSRPFASSVVAVFCKTGPTDNFQYNPFIHTDTPNQIHIYKVIMNLFVFLQSLLVLVPFDIIILSYLNPLPQP